MNREIKLLPCPFCNSLPYYSCEAYNGKRMVLKVRLQCSFCSCEFNQMAFCSEESPYGINSVKSDLAEEWNTRHDPELLKG